MGIVCVGLVLAGAGSGCRRLDPQKELSISGLEAYWVIDAPVGNEQYIAPAVRLVLRNKGEHTARALETTAVFRRKGEEKETWGSDWMRVAPQGKPLAPGQETVLVMKSDARYRSAGTPDSMFRHELFKDAKVEVFVRLGSSAWTKVGELEVERRIGSKTVEVAPR